MTTATTATGTSTTDPIMDLVQYQKDLASKKTSTSTATTESTSSSLGKDDFMQLLVTQLRYQDPLSPQDNQQMAAQMAQFSSLESIQNVQKSVEELGETFKTMADKQTDAANAMSSGSATSMLGKTARFQVESIELPSLGSKSKLPVHANAGSVAAVKDADGKTVKTIALTDLVNSEGTVSWDGTDDDGNRAPSGSYTISIQDQATGKASGYAYEDATILGVSFDDDGPVLRSANGSYSLTKLVEIGADSTGKTSSGDNGAAVSAALAIVGKDVKFRDAAAELGSAGAKWTFTAAEGSIGQILDEKGNVVKSFSVSGSDSEGNTIMNATDGYGTYKWDGELASGNDAERGTYYLRIVDPTGKTTTGTTFRSEKVDSVAFDAMGNPKLVSGDEYWSLSELFTI